MKRYHADECCKSGWEDAQFYLCSEADAALAQARREGVEALAAALTKRGLILRWEEWQEEAARLLAEEEDDAGRK